MLALQFMTRLPLPDVRADAADFAACMRWFPLAGLVVGTAVALGAWAGAHVDLWTGALLGLGIWVAITGALHLDGLGDMADAAGAVHKGRERLTSVLADPHIGSFGVTAIALQLLAKLVLLHTVLAAGVTLWTLPVLCMIARIGPLVWALTLPPLHEGLASRFRDGIGWRQVALWAVPAAIGMWFAPGLAAVMLVIPAWRWWIAARIGGISGDGHGAGIEWCESALLLALVFCA